MVAPSRDHASPVALLLWLLCFRAESALFAGVCRISSCNRISLKNNPSVRCTLCTRMFEKNLQFIPGREGFRGSKKRLRRVVRGHVSFGWGQAQQKTSQYFPGTLGVDKQHTTSRQAGNTPKSKRTRQTKTTPGGTSFRSKFPTKYNSCNTGLIWYVCTSASSAGGCEGWVVTYS